ncbi:hypothetical protein [Streptomyces sp. NPDC047079]|uniref:hypothetical protein n=1 Tax=Streptomyces sp. NPDC047079 TaxID=3154607 RepID=UPI0033E49814
MRVQQFALAGARVTGLDPAAPLLEQAEQLDRASGNPPRPPSPTSKPIASGDNPSSAA